jgi:MYXO-CTERM domain-containing protein
MRTKHIVPATLIYAALALGAPAIASAAQTAPQDRAADTYPDRGDDDDSGKWGLLGLLGFAGLLGLKRRPEVDRMRVPSTATAR